MKQGVTIATIYDEATLGQSIRPCRLVACAQCWLHYSNRSFTSIVGLATKQFCTNNSLLLSNCDNIVMLYDDINSKNKLSWAIN